MIEVVVPSDVCEDGEAICELVYEWTGSEVVAEATRWTIGAPLQILFITIAAVVITRMTRRSIARISAGLGRAAAKDTALLSEATSERAVRRAASISTLLRSTTTVVVYSSAALMILDRLGLSIVPLLASAGIAGIAIGFGAQRLIEDVITGVFMLIEDQFGVGDRIDIDFVDGTVEALTLRTTVIRDPDGTLWHIPNSEIRRVANESQLWSRAVVDMGVAYGTPADLAISVLTSSAEELAASPVWAAEIIEQPRVLGIQELGDDAVMFRVIARVEPIALRQFERDLRRALMEGLEVAEVEMPNRQLDIWMREADADPS